jgi:DNA-binding response OmpR family regulator
MIDKFTAYNLRELEISIIEKKTFAQSILNSVLKELGVGKINCFESFSDAVYAMNEFVPDIVVTDWSSDYSALEFLDWIRNGDSSPEPFLPVIIMSNNCALGNIKQARDTGVDEFLARPISPSILYDRICRIIRVRPIFVKTSDFFGPNRRRSDRGFFNFPDRRKTQNVLYEKEGSIDTSTDTDKIPEPLVTQKELDVLLN